VKKYLNVMSWGRRRSTGSPPARTAADMEAERPVAPAPSWVAPMMPAPAPVNRVGSEPCSAPTHGSRGHGRDYRRRLPSIERHGDRRRRRHLARPGGAAASASFGLKISGCRSSREATRGSPPTPSSSRSVLLPRAKALPVKEASGHRALPGASARWTRRSSCSRSCRPARRPSCRWVLVRADQTAVLRKWENAFVAQPHLAAKNLIDPIEPGSSTRSRRHAVRPGGGTADGILPRLPLPRASSATTRVPADASGILDTDLTLIRMKFEDVLKGRWTRRRARCHRSTNEWPEFHAADRAVQPLVVRAPAAV